MATFLRDIPNTAVMKEAIAVRTVTQTATGTYFDLIDGDGRCSLVLQVTGFSATAMTVRVQQSTLTNSGFADISGAEVTATTTGITGFSFDRDYRYVQAVATINGTTATVAAVAFEQKKQF